jgi:septal ring-binding cell division protein DamX
MRRRLITTGLLVGGLALAAAACGTSDPQVQARQTGDTSATTAAPTTTAAPSTTAAPDTTTSPATTAAPAAPACTVEALTAAYTAKFGAPLGAFKPLQCVSGWATSSEVKGFNPPTFTLYRAEGDHWVVLNRSAGKLCEGQGVPAEVAPQIGCDT